MSRTNKPIVYRTQTCNGEGNGNPLQYSCLEIPMDGRAQQAAVHGVSKSQTPLSDFTFTFMHWKRKWQPTPVFLPGESQGWRLFVKKILKISLCHTHKSVAFLYTSNEQSEKEIFRKTSLFAIARTKVKYFTDKAKGLYTENYKALLKEIET